MGANQGVKWVREGIERKLTKHEFARGYIFLTRDVNLNDVLDVDDFTVEVDGERFPHRHVGKWGRFGVPRRFLRERFSSHDRVRLQLRSRKLLVMERA